MGASRDEDDARATPALATRRAARSGRATTIALGAIFVVVIALLARGPRRAHRAQPPAGPASSQGEEAKGAGEERLERAIADLRVLPELQDDRAKEVLSALAYAGPSDAGFLLPDGATPPPLASTAPKSVHFGLVVVRYRGAQLAPAAAPPRAEALAHANALHDLAQRDFAAAVKAGDLGSALDVGGVRRGDLEPALQYVLFSLPKGGISEVVDAPRGFWIMRRID